METSKRNAWLGVIAVVLLAFAGYRVLFGAGGKPDLPDTFRGAGVCLGCDEEALVEFKRGEGQPYTCQACGEQTVLLWWFCYDCGYRFIPELVPNPDGLPHPTPYPTCMHCGCKSLASWDPDNPALAPEGNAKPPKWPQ